MKLLNNLTLAAALTTAACAGRQVEANSQPIDTESVSFEAEAKPKTKLSVNNTDALIEELEAGNNDIAPFDTAEFVRVSQQCQEIAAHIMETADLKKAKAMEYECDTLAHSIELYREMGDICGKVKFDTKAAIGFLTPSDVAVMREEMAIQQHNAATANELADFFATTYHKKCK